MSFKPTGLTQRLEGLQIVTEGESNLLFHFRKSSRVLRKIAPRIERWRRKIREVSEYVVLYTEG